MTHLLINRDLTAASGRVDVERAIAEIRAGRPVILRHGIARVVALAAETLDEDLAEGLALIAQGAARLILPAPRLRRLGFATDVAGALALPMIDLARIRMLSEDSNARLDAPASALSPLDAGALELLRLAQAYPAAVVVDGASAEIVFPNLLSVALTSVGAYRKAAANSIRIASRARVPLDGAPQSEFVVFRGGEGLRDQAAIIIGSLDFSRPVHVRLHSACLTGDLFGSLKCDCGDQLRYAARHMAQNGGGIILYLDQEGRGNGLANKIRAYDLQSRGFDTYDADEALGFDSDGRNFDFAAAMLVQLGARRVRILTNNPDKIAALREGGLEVVSDHRLQGRNTDDNIRYLAAKRDKAGHLIELDRAPA